MRTINSSYLYLYLNQTTDNPVTVTSTGSISSKANGIALHLMPPTDNPNLFWSVTNYGRITSSGTASQGVVIENSGRLVNGSSAATNAYIAGGALGVSFPQGAGQLVNYGTMVASGLNSTVADLKKGGQVTISAYCKASTMPASSGSTGPPARLRITARSTRCRGSPASASAFIRAVR